MTDLQALIDKTLAEADAFDSRRERFEYLDNCNESRLPSLVRQTIEALQERVKVLEAAAHSADGDLCETCGNRYETIYRVPDDVWAAIAPRPDDLGPYPEHQAGGLLCMSCADERARQAGIRLYWDASSGDWESNLNLEQLAAKDAEIERLDRIVAHKERELQQIWGP